MKVEKYEGNQERMILLAMVTDKQVLGPISAKWTGKMFASSWANILGDWCVKHFKKYERAPRKGIQSMFTEWAEKGSKDREMVETMESFLSSLSDEYEKHGDVSPKYVLDQAGAYFNQVRASKLATGIEQSLDQGNYEKAEHLITEHRKVELGAGRAIDLFQDLKAIQSTYQKETREPLVVYPGALGQFFANQLGRGCFLAFQGPEKSGKSYNVLDIAVAGMFQRRRVAYFQAGDLSEADIKDRFLVRVKRHPSESTNGDLSWPCEIDIPVRLERKKDDRIAQVTASKVKRFDRPIDSAEEWAEEIVALVRDKLKSKRSFLKISVHANDLTVAGMRAILDAWALDGWIPDIVVTDYADILVPADPRAERLHQVRQVWQDLRRLNLQLDCLMLSATQTKAAAYGKEIQDRSDFSENHLKYAEVTAMVAINQKPEEKEKQISRLSYLVRRKGAFSIRKCVHLAGCLAISSPWIKSCW